MLISLIFATFIFFLLLAMTFGVPYVPTRKNTAEKIIELLKIKPGDRFYDLGSGDGRLLFMAAEKGAKSTGIEMNPHLVLWTWLKILLKRKWHQVSVRLGNYWWTDLSTTDKVVIYGMPSVMAKASKKFMQELRTGTLIASNSFKIPDLKLVKTATVGKDTVYLYRK